MQPWQEVADVASLLGSCHSTSSPLHFHEDDLFEQRDNSVGSFVEQMRLATMQVNMCSDDYWYGLGHYEPIANSVGSFDEQMRLATMQVNMCTDDYWHGLENWKPIANENDVDAMDDSPRHLFERVPLETKMASSSACGSSSHTCETSTTVIHGVSSTASFIHPSPVFSEGSSSLPAADQPCINNHACAHPSVNAHMYMEPVNGLAYDNEYTTKCDNFACDTATSFNDILFDTEVSSSHAPIASPHSYGLNGGCDPSLNLTARAIVQQQFHLEQSNHQRGAIRPGRALQEESQESVSFLVENGTPTIEDGYVWRKYGQKKIKDKTHPRSYFRCAQPDCPIKKQTESSSDIWGSVLITYFGRHNHPV